MELHSTIRALQSLTSAREVLWVLLAFYDSELKQQELRSSCMSFQAYLDSLFGQEGTKIERVVFPSYGKKERDAPLEVSLLARADVKSYCLVIDPFRFSFHVKAVSHFKSLFVN